MSPAPTGESARLDLIVKRHSERHRKCLQVNADFRSMRMRVYKSWGQQKTVETQKNSQSIFPSTRGEDASHFALLDLGMPADIDPLCRLDMQYESDCELLAYGKVQKLDTPGKRALPPSFLLAQPMHPASKPAALGEHYLKSPPTPFGSRDGLFLQRKGRALAITNCRTGQGGLRPHSCRIRMVPG